MWQVNGKPTSPDFFGDFVPSKTLIDFDGPGLFLFSNQEEMSFVACDCDCNENLLRFLVAPCSFELQGELEQGRLPLRDIFDTAAKVWIVDIERGWITRKAWEVKLDDLPEEYLPLPGATHTPSDEDLLTEIRKLLDQFESGRLQPVSAESIIAAPWEHWGAAQLPAQKGKVGRFLGLSAKSRSEPHARSVLRGSGSDRSPSISVQHGLLVVALPVEQVPYGIARVLCRDVESDMLVGTALLPMELVDREGKSLRVGEVLVQTLIGRKNYEGIHFFVQPATEETLELFPAAEVEALLSSAKIQASTTLREGIQNLLAMR